MKGVYVSVIDEAGQELEKRKNEMLQNPALRVTESSCNRAFHTMCLGSPPAAAHARQLTCTRDVFEEGGSVPLGQESCLKDSRHRLCTTCLVECTGSTDTMYSVKLPDIVAQQQDNKRLNNNNWRKAQQHKQKLGKLDHNGMRVASFYRSRAGNVTVALSETLTAQVSALPAKHNQEFHAAVNSITGILSSMRHLPAEHPLHKMQQLVPVCRQQRMQQ
ncbi:hypothetical protein ABBQ32_008753 [Trebouxia sp. C0010 RCD-2024]